TLGSGTDSTWFGGTSRVRSNQKAAIWFSTWPLNGIVPSTRSKAEMRSVTTIVRRPSRTYESRTLPSCFAPSSGRSVRSSVRAHCARSSSGSMGKGGCLRRGSAGSGLDALDPPVLDHGLGEQLLAQLADQPLGGGAVGGGQLDLEVLALAHVGDALVAERRAGALDRAALGIEHVGLEGHGHDRLHRASSRSAAPSVRAKMASTLRRAARSEEHTSELQSRENLVCRLLLEKKKEA